MGNVAFRIPNQRLIFNCVFDLQFRIVVVCSIKFSCVVFAWFLCVAFRLVSCLSLTSQAFLVLVAWNLGSREPCLPYNPKYPTLLPNTQHYCQIPNTTAASLGQWQQRLKLNRVVKPCIFYIEQKTLFRPDTSMKRNY